MLQAYVNYPNPRISIHGLTTCSDIGKMKKAGQRHVLINDRSISSELQKFASKAYRFNADAAHNDMWLSIDFGDAAFERAVVDYLQRLVGRHYSPFAGVTIEQHC